MARATRGSVRGVLPAAIRLGVRRRVTLVVLFVVALLLAVGVSAVLPVLGAEGRLSQRVYDLFGRQRVTGVLGWHSFLEPSEQINIMPNRQFVVREFLEDGTPLLIFRGAQDLDGVGRGRCDVYDPERIPDQWRDDFLLEVEREDVRLPYWAPRPDDSKFGFFKCSVGYGWPFVSFMHVWQLSPELESAPPTPWYRLNAWAAGMSAFPGQSGSALAKQPQHYAPGLVGNLVFWTAGLYLPFLLMFFVAPLAVTYRRLRGGRCGVCGHPLAEVGADGRLLCTECGRRYRVAG